MDTAEKKKVVEKAYIVGVRTQATSRADADEHLEELAQLVDTMGVPAVGRIVATVDRMNPAYLTGSGKAKEIVEAAKEAGADCLVFDEDLSPSQQRNWEKLSDLAAIDRREVILDIFAQRARTREARLQSQLARLEYSLPRLTRAWSHLERQRGGGGFRGGSGEMQLETDRRIVRNQITTIKRELETVRRQRATQRKSRGAEPTPVAAIVGYTNAGKSTLLHALTGAQTLIEDKLFATLDPLTRRIVLPNRQELLVTDTVGFIRKLPHDLVESFKATLEETALADMLIHVVDASHPQAREQLETTQSVLREIGAGDKPSVIALNKVDRLATKADAAGIAPANERAVTISAESGEGLEELLSILTEMSSHTILRVKLLIPADRYDLVARVHREAKVWSEAHEEDGVALEADVSPKLMTVLEAFRVEG